MVLSSALLRRTNRICRGVPCSRCSPCTINSGKCTGKNIVALDCEMLSCRPTRKWFVGAAPSKKRKRPREVSVAGQCAIVNYDCSILYYSHILPGERTSVINNWRGIRPEDLAGAPSLTEAREHILRHLRDKLVVAHDIRHDLAALQIHMDSHLPIRSIRDTSTCASLRRIAGVSRDIRYAGLRHLALGLRIQTTRPHCPIEDATAAMKLYRVVENEWEKERNRTENN